MFLVQSPRSSSFRLVLARVFASTRLTITAQYRPYLPSAEGSVPGTTTEDGKVSLVAGVTADLTQKIRAGDLVGEISKIVGGRGGGRPDFARPAARTPGRWMPR